MPCQSIATADARQNDGIKPSPGGRTANHPKEGLFTVGKKCMGVRSVKVTKGLPGEGNFLLQSLTGSLVIIVANRQIEANSREIMDTAQLALLFVIVAAACFLIPFMTFVFLRWLWRQIRS